MATASSWHNRVPTMTGGPNNAHCLRWRRCLASSATSLDWVTKCDANSPLLTSSSRPQFIRRLIGFLFPSICVPFSVNPIITFLAARLISDWFWSASSSPIPAYFLLLLPRGLCAVTSRVLVGRCSVIPIKVLPIPTAQRARLAVDWFLSKPIISSSRPSSLPAFFIGF